MSLTKMRIARVSSGTSMSTITMNTTSWAILRYNISISTNFFCRMNRNSIFRSFPIRMKADVVSSVPSFQLLLMILPSNQVMQIIHYSKRSNEVGLAILLLLFVLIRSFRITAAAAIDEESNGLVISFFSYLTYPTRAIRISNDGGRR